MAANFANNANPPEAGSFFTLLLAFSIVFLFAQFAWFAAIDFFNSPTAPTSSELPSIRKLSIFVVDTVVAND